MMHDYSCRQLITLVRHSVVATLSLKLWAVLPFIFGFVSLQAIIVHWINAKWINAGCFVLTVMFVVYIIITSDDAF